jgi:hypothetical protein
MYAFLLSLHSLFRWVVLITLLVSLARAYYGWLGHKTFTAADNLLRIISITAAHVQLIIGVTFYMISPVVKYFWSNFASAVHERQIRFFGMEHITMMLTAIVLLTIGLAKAKRKRTDAEKFKTIAVWLTIALLIILTSVPWSFSPLTSRPNWRSF